MATPALKDGFYELGGWIPHHSFDQAVRSGEVTKLGRRVRTTFKEIGEIDLMVTGAVAVSTSGERAGKGTGYFDQEYAILREIGSVNEETPIVAVVSNLQIYERLPYSSNDVLVDYIVTPNQVIKTASQGKKPLGIDRNLLTKRSIQRMQPLKELFA